MSSPSACASASAGTLGRPAIAASTTADSSAAASISTRSAASGSLAVAASPSAPASASWPRDGLLLAGDHVRRAHRGVGGNSRVSVSGESCDTSGAPTRRRTRRPWGRSRRALLLRESSNWTTWGPPRGRSRGARSAYLCVGLTTLQIEGMAARSQWPIGPSRCARHADSTLRPTPVAFDRPPVGPLFSAAPCPGSLRTPVPAPPAPCAAPASGRPRRSTEPFGRAGQYRVPDDVARRVELGHPWVFRDALGGRPSASRPARWSSSTAATTCSWPAASSIRTTPWPSAC